MDAFEILVIILSVFLAIFLLLSIAIAVLTLKLVKSLREVATKGGAIVDRVEEIGETFAKNAGAVGLLRMLMKFVTTASKHKRR
ncbi:hypothetical protein IPP75_00390 [Candidatus Saccharibacteria bacterium]|nr:MAG: hypothetical protein IPP75_00390 [Candidatus Saccharibacteria bacterium]